MEYAEKGDFYLLLRERQKKKKLLAETQIIKWFAQLTMAVEYLHKNRVLHRDLKLANIFLDKSDNVKIGDFGISKTLKSCDQFTQSTVGTPYYISPEICLNRPYGTKSDIWSLGCILFELMHLSHAFDAQTMAELTGKIVQGNYKKVNSEYSQQLRNLLEELLQVRAENRPSAEEILKKPIFKEIVGEMSDCTMTEDVKGSTAATKKLNLDKRSKLEKALTKLLGKEKLEKAIYKIKVNL